MNDLILAARNLIASTAHVAPSSVDVAWDRTHLALLQGRWPEARAGLDELLAHHQDEAHDYLPALGALPTQPPAEYLEILHDRLLLWEAAVERCAAH